MTTGDDAASGELFEKPAVAGGGKFNCGNCGAELEFKPGDDALVCSFCGHKNTIKADDAPIVELDFEAFLTEAESDGNNQSESLTVDCSGCGAIVTLEANVTSDDCPFCGSKLIAQSHTKKAIKPASLLPFQIPENKARELFSAWLKSLWFAPSNLKTRAEASNINGIYSPYWTYDSDTISRYTGERGTYYYVTETYSTTVNGKRVTRTRQVRKVRWTPVSGTVSRFFDDVLVLATKSLPDKIVNELEPWPLKNLTPYQDAYLSGFRSESYTVGLKDGFKTARDKMDVVIREDARRDIGGDEQRVHSVNTSYKKITFKHILLPVWISAYRYKDKPFRFVVNGCTGEVQGERPWSVVKIVALVLFIIALIVGIYFLATNA